MLISANIQYIFSLSHLLVGFACVENRDQDQYNLPCRLIVALKAAFNWNQGWKVLS